tara:strand:- start:61 stop:387 length:327 start_codon:yes stop_codon:yes gene_type:complete
VHKDEDLFVEKFEDYLPNQLKQLLAPEEVEKEHGIPISSLKYMKEISNDTKVLRGPFFLQDGNITWYPRKAVIIYKRKIMFLSKRSSESSKSSKPEEVKKPNQSKQLS